MIETILPFLFGAMMIMVVVWFVLITRLFNQRRDNHPETYERLGSPSLFYHNSMMGLILLVIHNTPVKGH